MSITCIAPELSQIVSMNDVDREGIELNLEATKNERAALRQRFAIIKLVKMTATVHLCRESKAMIKLSAHLGANVVQACVYTLEPVKLRIDEEFVRRFVFGTPELEAKVAFDPLVDEPPEYLKGFDVDIGEIMSEHLGLALNPYPRAPEAFLESSWEDDPSVYELRNDSPFDVLHKLRKP